MEEVRAAAIKYGDSKIVGSSEEVDSTIGSGPVFGAALFDGVRHYDGLEPPATGWSSIFFLQSVRSPKQIYTESCEEDGLPVVVFENIPDVEKVPFVEVALLELAAFVAWAAQQPIQMGFA